jgi:tetratricopeptide (TPR) repeat protein
MSEKARLYGMIGVGTLAVIALASIIYLNTSGEKPSSEGKTSSKKSSGKATKKAASKEKAPADREDALSPPPADDSAADPADPAADPASSAMVEDVEEDDEIEEEAKLRKLYDHTLKRAKQFLQGEKYAQAAALFTEGLELASRIDSASKDILALYNNRSAMYEKNGELENSLMDIVVVLTMDGKHLKARTRRARILEKQGKFEEALNDLVFCSIVEGASGIPSSSGAKVQELCKKVSIPEVSVIVDRIRNSPSRPLPNKGYCRNFFESFMSYQSWKRQFKDVDRDELVRRSYHELQTANPIDGAITELKDIVDLIKVDLISQEFVKAFAHITRARALLASQQLVDNTSNDVVSTRALMDDLQGIEMHLRCNLTGALTHYITALKEISFGNLTTLRETAVAKEAEAGFTVDGVAAVATSEEHQQHAIEIVLRLASAYIELGEKDKAEDLYEAVRLSTDVTAPANLAGLFPWVLIHRVTLHITRDELGNFPADGVDLAISDLEKALEITEDTVQNDPVAVQCRVMALLKLVHVISQTKVQMGQPPSDAELEKVSSYIQDAKRLSPLNENVIMLDADLLSINGESDAALARCDEVILLSDKTDSVPYVIKANVMMQKAMMEMQMAQSQQSQQLMARAQQTMAEVDGIFQEAIKIEPNGLEAFAQYAQLKSMMGELDTSLEFLERALVNSRSKDEVQELCVMKVQTVSQKAAVEEYKNIAQ